MKTMKCIKGNVGSGLLLLLSLLLLHAVQSDCRLNVGVLPQEKDIINQIMDKKYPRATKLNFYTFDISISDSGLEHVEKVIEYMNEQKIHVVIGPFDELISIATEYLNITYIATTEVTSDQLQSTFQILPKLEDVGQAFLDMSNKYDWDKVSIFFDDEKDMSVVEKLLSDPLLKLKAWRLDKLSNKTKVHEHLIHMQKLPLQRSIVICRRANVEILLEKAFSLAMFSTPYEWFFYDPGDELDEVISRFPNIDVNFTLFTMIPSSPSNRLRGNYFHRTLAEDAVALLQEAMKRPFRKNEKGIIRISLVQRISAIVFNGKSGSIQFDGHGKRMHSSITLKSRSRYSTKKIGEWHSGADHFDRRLQVNYKMDSEERLQSFPLTNLKVRVVTILEKPFCMYKRDHNVRHGNDRFEGFALDVLREVASILNFEYEVYLVHDGKFGSKRDDGSWNGMIGEILEGVSIKRQYRHIYEK